MKNKNELLIQFINSKSDDHLLKVIELYDELKSMGHIKDLAINLNLTKSGLDKFVAYYRLYAANKTELINKLRQNLFSTSWAKILHILKSNSVERLKALRKEYLKAYQSEVIWDGNYTDENTGNLIKYTGRSQGQIRKSLCLTINEMLKLQKHIYLGRWDMPTHIKKMEQDDYKNKFNKFEVI